MTRKTKGWLISGAVFLLVGLAMILSVLPALDWDFRKLSTGKYETNTHTAEEAFRNIFIDTSTADILFTPSTENELRVVLYELNTKKHTVTVTDDTLSICEQDERKWYEFIFIAFDSPKITIFLPGSEYERLFIRNSTGDIEIPDAYQFDEIDISLSTGDVTNRASAESILIKASTGSITLEGISAETIDLTISTGKTLLTDIRCNSLNSSGSTGRITLTNVIASKTLTITRSTGDIRLDSCDAQDITITTNTGDVRGSLLTGKEFSVHTSTGSVSVPEAAPGGRCKITTSTGNIAISIQS